MGHRVDVVQQVDVHHRLLLLAKVAADLVDFLENIVAVVVVREIGRGEFLARMVAEELKGPARRRRRGRHPSRGYQGRPGQPREKGAPAHHRCIPVIIVAQRS
jgi:hypothetical protein